MGGIVQRRQKCYTLPFSNIARDSGGLGEAHAGVGEVGERRDRGKEHTYRLPLQYRL
jgi:hypothetical protein